MESNGKSNRDAYVAFQKAFFFDLTPFPGLKRPRPKSQDWYVTAQSTVILSYLLGACMQRSRMKYTNIVYLQLCRFPIVVN